MLEETLDVYRELQQHLDKFVVGFPATESGSEIRVLKHLFTPEEAKIASKLSDKAESVEAIYARAGDLVESSSELRDMLDNLVSKGSIHYRIRDGEKQYSLAYLAVGMYEYQVNRLTKEFLEDMMTYNEEAFGLEMFGYGVPQFRTVPIEASVTPEHHLPTYDELTKIVENISSPLVLVNCICRQAHEMTEGPCEVTSRQETCMGFGDFAQMYINEGWGRGISKAEALEVLRENEKEGLVLQGMNAKRPGFICSCCGDCCGVLSNLKEFPNIAQFLSPNYQAQIDPELCVGCGTCIERCQVDAIKSRKEISKVNIKRCVGCGNCVAVCPEEAITLIKRDKVIEPAENIEQMFERILDAKMKMKGK